jgi:hypothetical protein
MKINKIAKSLPLKRQRTSTMKSIQYWRKEIRDLPCSWLGSVSIVRMAEWPKQSAYSMQSHQNSNVVLHRDRKINPNFHMEAKKTPNSQSNPEHTVIDNSYVLTFWNSNYIHIRLLSIHFVWTFILYLFHLIVFLCYIFCF